MSVIPTPEGWRQRTRHIRPFLAIEDLFFKSQNIIFKKKEEKEKADSSRQRYGFLQTSFTVEIEYHSVMAERFQIVS